MKALIELRDLLVKLPAVQLAVVIYVVRRLASGERLTLPRDGIGTAAEYAAYMCDRAVDRIAEFLEHGPNAAVSPTRISAPRGS